MTDAVQRRTRTRPKALGRAPRVSVLVPVYNHGRYLRPCLQSVLDQPGVEVDILVIDDCSTDDSLDVAAKMAVEDPRIRVIAHETNMGHIPTLNEGMPQLTGTIW